MSIVESEDKKEISTVTTDLTKVRNVHEQFSGCKIVQLNKSHLMDRNLENLWIGIKCGDELALKRAFEMYYASLCYTSLQITHDRLLSEEIVQDVFLKLWEDRATITIKSSFKSYLYKSVRNLSINEIKKKITTKGSVNRTVSEGVWHFIADHTESQDYILDYLESEEALSIIGRAIRSLPKQCGSVFHLSRVQNMTNKEIAKRMKISVNTVRAHIFHALERISMMLKKERIGF